jgi:hypothetical protein
LRRHVAHIGEKVTEARTEQGGEIRASLTIGPNGDDADVGSSGGRLSTGYLERRNVDGLRFRDRDALNNGKSETTLTLLYDVWYAISGIHQTPPKQLWPSVLRTRLRS